MFSLNSLSINISWFYTKDLQNIFVFCDTDKLLWPIIKIGIWHSLPAVISVSGYDVMTFSQDFNVALVCVLYLGHVCLFANILHCCVCREPEYKNNVRWYKTRVNGIPSRCVFFVTIIRSFDSVVVTARSIWPTVGLLKTCTATNVVQH